ncbi:MAG: hypothetical protein SPL13_02640 [Clostridia bacterium]|nr:hypothetical protein [Clostridia bacterium]
MPTESAPRGRKHPPFYRQLLQIVKSKRARNIVISLFVIFATVSMFCIDTENVFRDKYLPFLNSNFIADLFIWLGIGRYDVTASSWCLFGCIMSVIVMLLIGNIVAPKFVESLVAKNRDLFSTETKVRVFFSTIYYFILLLLAGAIVLGFYFLGAFDFFRANTVEKSPFVSLMIMLGIFLCILLIIPIAVIIVYTVIKAIFGIINYFWGATVYFGEDLSAERAKDAARAAAKGSAGAGAGAGDVAYGDIDSIFPSLVAIDKENETPKEATVSTDITLEEFVNRFQSFAINKHQIYYEKSLLRQFLAGLAASRLIILEGLSGTGKSMLPRMFKEFTGSDAFFMPVQATWRDKTDVLGFYSEFTRTFKTTVFLEKLYAAAYSDKVNLMILDEMNLSRIEYYFADFLSVLEYPEEDWQIKAYLPFKDQVLPKKLENGFISIPNNTWFVGTANTDDSTFTITDKVCDRAIILNFEDRFSRIESTYESEPISISAERLTQLFNEALADESKCLNDADLKKFEALCEYVKDKFEILFGNRIMVQIEKFVPVYVALGGTKEEALDFMFAKKILRKFEGKYEEYFKDELIALTGYINNTYGKGVFKQTERFIEKMTKRLV